MKFTINSGDFNAKLNLLSKVQNAKQSIQILDCVKIDLNADTITMTACDGENTVITSMPVTEAEDVNQSICVRLSLLSNALREVPNQPITFTANDQTLEVTISYLSGKFNFVGQDASQFPDIRKELTNANQFTMPANTLLSGLQTTKESMADDELRPIMNGTYCDFQANGDVVFVSSDGHRLTRNTYRNICPGMQQPFGFVLSRKASWLLSAALAKLNDDIEVQTTDTHATFRFADTFIYVRLREGHYPNYNSVIPKENPFTITVDRDALISTLRRILVFANENTALVSLKIENNKIHVSAQDFDFSRSSEEYIECEGNGADLSIGFKGTFLLNLLRLLPAGNIQLHLANDKQAGVITPAEQGEEEDLLLLLMPMMLS